MATKRIKVIVCDQCKKVQAPGEVLQGLMLQKATYASPSVGVMPFPSNFFICAKCAKERSLMSVIYLAQRLNGKPDASDPTPGNV